MIARVLILLIASYALSGCRDALRDDFILPVSHPAHPEAAAAAPLAVTTALEPEFEDVRPDLETPSAPAPETGGTAHHHGQ